MKPRSECECEHDFVLVLSEIPELTAEDEDALFESGCADATISVRSGRVFLTFSREAASFKDAVLSAIRDVGKARIGADVLRVDHCNLVSQADIARKIERSRQLVHQYISGHRGPGGFPAPACEITDGAPLWSWCEVAYWFWRNDMIQESAVREASEAVAINAMLELAHIRRCDPELSEELINELVAVDAPAKV